MPSKVVTANTTAQTIAAERENAAVLAKSITIDNLNGAGDRVITIQDIFTPAVTDGVAGPVLTTVSRLTYTALQGDQITLGEDEIKEVKCLGAMAVISDVIDASCIISVGYQHEE